MLHALDYSYTLDAATFGYGDYPGSSLHQFTENWVIDINVTHSLDLPWWRHQMETFSALLALCAGNPSVSGEFPAQRPVTRSLDVFFDLCLNKRLSKKSWGWWFETPSRPLWRHCNVLSFSLMTSSYIMFSILVAVTVAILALVGHDAIIKWKHFFVLLALCEENPSVTSGFPSQRTRSFDVFFDLPDQTVEQTIGAPVIWDAIALIMTSLWCGMRLSRAAYWRESTFC